MGVGVVRGSSLGGATLLVAGFATAAGGIDGFTPGRGAEMDEELDAFALGAPGIDTDPDALALLGRPVGFGGGTVGRTRGGGLVGATMVRESCGVPEEPV